MKENNRLVLMIGLPSCGKTHTSRRLAGPGDVLIEFDEYFYTEVGEDPADYNWSRTRLPDACAWNFERICAAIDAGSPCVIVDSDNGPHAFTRSYVEYAIERGYEVELREPDSPWWRQVRTLLADRYANREALQRWAHKLSAMSRGTHRVPVRTFVRRINKWIPDMTVEDILAAGTSKVS